MFLKVPNLSHPSHLSQSQNSYLDRSSNSTSVNRCPWCSTFLMPYLRHPLSSLLSFQSIGQMNLWKKGILVSVLLFIFFIFFIKFVNQLIIRMYTIATISVWVSSVACYVMEIGYLVVYSI